MCHNEFRIRLCADPISRAGRSQAHHYAVDTCDVFSNPQFEHSPVWHNAAGFWTYAEAYNWAVYHGYTPTWDTEDPLDYED